VLGLRRPTPPTEITPCKDLPQLWSGAVEIDYDSDARVVTFVWSDGSHAHVRDSDPGCPGQPGLDEELRGNRQGWLANEKVACHDLRDLLDAVKADRSSRGLGTAGRVAVADSAIAAAARKNPGTADDASVAAITAKSHAGGQRTLDVDQATNVLARCPD
jgi:hypothetical protein